MKCQRWFCIVINPIQIIQKLQNTNPLYNQHWWYKNDWSCLLNYTPFVPNREWNKMIYYPSLFLFIPTKRVAKSRQDDNRTCRSNDKTMYGSSRLSIITKYRGSRIFLYFTQKTVSKWNRGEIRQIRFNSKLIPLYTRIIDAFV